MSLSDVLEKVAAYAIPTVCVTGGEPLAQKNCVLLLTALCDEGYSVSLETSGALDISQVDSRVARIVDIKPPGSGESQRNRAENLSHLTPRDEVKFVLADRTDYEWACAQMTEHALPQRWATDTAASKGMNRLKKILAQTLQAAEAAPAAK